MNQNVTLSIFYSYKILFEEFNAKYKEMYNECPNYYSGSPTPQATDNFTKHEINTAKQLHIKMAFIASKLNYKSCPKCHVMFKSVNNICDECETLWTAFIIQFRRDKGHFNM